MAQHHADSCKRPRRPIFPRIFRCLPYVYVIVLALTVLSACRADVRVEWFDPTPLPPRPIPPQIPLPVLPLTATGGLSSTTTLVPTAVAGGLPALPTFPPCPTPVANPTPGATWCEPPTSVSVKHHRMYTKGANRYIIGEIANDWITSLYWVTITARCYDANNHIIAANKRQRFLIRASQGRPIPLSSPYPMLPLASHDTS
jgi:hypothetical protein